MLTTLIGRLKTLSLIALTCAMTITQAATPDSTWQAPMIVEHLSPDQWNPATASNNSGIRFVAWQQSNGTGDDIWAVRHAADGTAGSPVLIAHFAQDYIAELKVSVDDAGNAFVAWVIDEAPFSAPRRLWVNRFVAGSGWGSGWGTPQVIDGYAKRSATNLHLVFDHAGNAFALWQEYDCCSIHSLQSIVVNRYTKLAGWSKPVRLDDAQAFLAGKINIQVDGAGNAYASWTRVADIHYPTPDLLVSRYALNSGWNTQIIATESAYNSAGNQALAVNPRGEAFLMWADDGGLKFARANESGQWGATILIDPNVTFAPSQMVLLDDDEAFAVFIDGVKRFMPENGWWSWTHPLMTNQNASSEPRIAADASGNALVAWTQNIAGVDRIYAKRYRADYGWLGAAPIDDSNTLGAGLEELRLNSGGTGSAAWWQSNDAGTVDIWAASFQ
ncbi:MAG: hypothetical protein QM808_05285 [Steroidobacteraceae bacterium]